MSQPDDHAQRDLEKRALRNVRGLVDKMEDRDRADNKAAARIAVVLVVVAVAFVGGVAWYVKRAEPPPATIVIPAPAKLAK